ncbi:hypothetical protein [Microvirga sp. 2TAF3]|uniref:hypothetical protein n=1 Tax=Microvirga sp. 2TAF3 TaxID=3233014 RepID=UPI003F98C9FA
MRRLLWIVAGTFVVLWSLLAWGAYGLIDLFGSTVVRHADVVSNRPETVEWLSWGLAALRNLGLAAVVFVWGLVSLLILAVPILMSFVLGRAARPASPMGWQMDYPRPGYRDVTPTDITPASNEDQRRIERH